tara:strand:+ start:6856 stop:10002 length:3147 start_codon:yes stop_codon:yes gene_type:complete
MEKNDLTTKITRLSLSRKVTVLVLFLTILAIGLISTNRLPLEMEPKGSEGHGIYVRTAWRSGVPMESMEKIGIPMEEELSTVRGLDSMSTRCSTSSASVDLRFKQGTDMAVAYREVRDRMERARLRFPEGTEKPRIYKRDSDPESIVRMTIGSQKHVPDYDLINKNVISPLLRIDGVADVEFHIEKKEIMIEIDKERAESLGLDMDTLARHLRGDNFTLSSGTVIDGGKKYVLKSSSSFKTFEEINTLPINDNVSLKDIAEIKYEPEMDKRFFRFNGLESYGIQVNKESEANTVEVSRRVSNQIELIKTNPALSAYPIRVYRNQGNEIHKRLSHLIDNGIYGAFLAAAVLFFFLRRLRMTLIIAMAIPLCLLCSLISMYFADQSLNAFNMVGLMICIGLLVDNSVVIAENIQRQFNNGMSRHDACMKGVNEVGLAIITATLTTMIVFVPMLFIGGGMRFVLSGMALPVMSAVLSSLIVALLFIPLCVYLTLPSSRTNRSNFLINQFRSATAQLEKIYALSFEKFNFWYNRALGYFLGRRLDLAVILIVLFAASYNIGYKNIEFSDEMHGQRNEFEIDIDFPDNYSIAERSAYIKQVEEYVEQRKIELGIKSYETHFSPWYAEFEGHFSDDRVSKFSTEEVAEEVYKNFPQVPGVRTHYSGMDGGEERNDYKSRQYVRLVGDDPTLLQTVAEDLRPQFEKLPGVIAIENRDDDEGPNEMALIINRDLANSVGVNPSTVAGAVSTAVRGSDLPRFKSKGRQIPVRLRLSEEDRSELDDINNMLVPTEDGRFSSIGTISRPAMLKSEDYIRRTNRKLSYTFGIKLKEGQEKTAKDNINNTIQNIDLPEGVSFGEIRKSFDDNDKENGELVVYLAILFIYMLIAFLFESMLMPISILLTIPLAAMGSIWIHYFTQTNMDRMGLVGAILLVGIVVNNGIVLVNYANQLRQSGMERAAAMMEASRVRFRPVFMTAMTTICGMIPLTFSSSNEMFRGVNYQSFGFTLIGGMACATLFTLLAVPVFYTLIDDAQIALRNTLAIAFDRGNTQKLTNK